MGVGYQIGEAVQMVKNTGELKNLNDKYEQLSQSLAQLASLKKKHSNGEQHSGCQQCFKRFKKLCE
ncbi:sabA [Helicobacter pylori Hp A-5]|nr:sabA [Helicobacter pylori Hp A-5]